MRDLSDWKDVRDNPPELPVEGKKPRWNFRLLPDEVWQDADPLSRILERNTLTEEEQKLAIEDSWGW